MKNANEKSLSCEWITPELIQEIRDVFEPRYKRKLTDDEVVEIAENLTGVLETFFKFKYEQQYEKNNGKQIPA